MSATLAFVDRLKRHVIGESLVRRNPFYYDRSRPVAGSAGRTGPRAAPCLDPRSAGTHLVAGARAPTTAASSRVATNVESWPLLEKELLRNRLHSFTTGREWFAAPAVTGGTTGVPLKLVRSLDGVVFEQACVDGVVRELGLHPRNVRTAVLRGDNLQDPRTLISPDGVSANGGRVRIFCARAVSARNIERLADSLEKFSPELLCAYPSALETMCRMLQERGRVFRVPAVLTSSEVLEPAGVVAGAGGARLPSHRSVWPGRTRGVRARLGAARIPLPAGLLARGILSVREQTTAARAALIGSTRSSAPACGTTSCRWCVTAPAT